MATAWSTFSCLGVGVDRLGFEEVYRLQVQSLTRIGTGFEQQMTPVLGLDEGLPEFAGWC